jgi:hypothetical protein
MVNSEDMNGTTEYLTLYARCRINGCCYNQVRLYYKDAPASAYAFGCR